MKDSKILVDNIDELVEIVSKLSISGVFFEAYKEAGVWTIEIK